MFDTATDIMFLIVLAFAGLAAFLAVGAGLYDDQNPDGSTAASPAARPAGSSDPDKPSTPTGDPIATD